MRVALALALLASCAPPSSLAPALSNHVDPTPAPVEIDWRTDCRRTGGRPLCFRVFMTPNAGMIRCGCCPARTSYETCRMWL